VTGVAYIGATFGFTIPVKLPPGYGSTLRGTFSVTSISYASVDGRTEPPICPVALTLGSNAVDQTVTLTYASRTSTIPRCPS
jgi:hypothetical protein